MAFFATTRVLEDGAAGRAVKVGNLRMEEEDQEEEHEEEEEEEEEEVE